MIFLLERLWSSHRTIPDFAPPAAPHGFGEWRVRFGPDGEHEDILAYARCATLAGAKTVTLWLIVRTPAGEEFRWRSVSGVAPFSSLDTGARLAAKAAGTATLFLNKARSMSPEAFSAAFKKHAASSVTDIAPVEPDAPDTGAHLIRLLRELKTDLLTRKQWRLLLGENTGGLPEAKDLVAITPPADRLWADPFLVEESGRTLVFFEEMTFAEKCGRIAVGEWTGRTLETVRTVLKTGSHLSYPQIFEHAGDRWLTAESATSGKLTAYRCLRFPETWEPGPVIFDRPVIDPSVFRHAGRWWLFGNLAAAPGAKADDDLHVFFSDDPLTGNWTSHPLNPVVSDARFARGAGRPFVRDGTLFRPAQDCAGGYGSKVVLREITTLTPEDFAERTVGEITPKTLPDAVALHTFNGGGKFVAADFAVRI